jgi:hypothetical protein
MMSVYACPLFCICLSPIPIILTWPVIWLLNYSLFFHLQICPNALWYSSNNCECLNFNLHVSFSPISHLYLNYFLIMLTFSVPKLTGKRKRMSDGIEPDQAKEKKTVTTQSHQGAASTWASSQFPLKGFGWLPTSFRIDAMDRSDCTFRLTQNDRDQSAAASALSSSSSVSPSLALWPTVRSVLCPTESDLRNVSVNLPLIGELMQMRSRGEKGSSGVKKTFNLSYLLL